MLSVPTDRIAEHADTRSVCFNFTLESSGGSASRKTNQEFAIYETDSFLMRHVNFLLAHWMLWVSSLLRDL